VHEFCKLQQIIQYISLSKNLNFSIIQLSKKTSYSKLLYVQYHSFLFKPCNLFWFAVPQIVMNVIIATYTKILYSMIRRGRSVCLIIASYLLFQAFSIFAEYTFFYKNQ